MWMDGKLRSLMEIIDEEEEAIQSIEENKEMPKEEIKIFKTEVDKHSSVVPQ